jgi:signal transduction histidine kinase
MKLTIFRKALILVSVPLLFQLAFTALVAVMQKRNADAGQWFAHTIVRAGEKERALVRLKARYGKESTEDLQTELEKFMNEEQRLEDLRQHTLRDAQQWLQWLAVGGVTLSLLTTAILASVLIRGVRDRLLVLTENVQRFAQGEELAPPITGSDEITLVDRAFRDMARDLGQAQDALRDQARMLRKLNEDLERRVLERTAELAESNRQLAEKNQENEMFVYSVSHDLRSPLVNLQGFSEELNLVCQDLRGRLTGSGVPQEVREWAGGLLDGDMAQSIRFIQTGVTRLSHIIDALLRLSRAGRVEYQWQPVDVFATVTRVTESMNGTIADRSAAVTVGSLPPAWGDPTAVEQLFANLIGNALNYLDPERPGAIEVGTVHPAEGHAPNGDCRFRTYYVRDNGRGISENYRSKIFQAFQRLHPQAAKGEGIGLAMVHRIVERHGGRIWFESVEGAGTTFYVSLPTPLAPEDPKGPQLNGVHQRGNDDHAISATGYSPGR